MAQLFARLRMLIDVLLDRPIAVKLRSSGEGFFYPGGGVVLPAIAGASDEDDDAGGDDDGKDDDEADSDDSDDDEADDSDDEDDGKEKDADYWRKQHRRYERTIKRKRERDKKELKEAQDKLKEIENSKKSDQEKAVEKAKEEGRTEALSEAEKARRDDRLEAACVRQAAKKIEVGDGDDKKKVRFDDPEDAEVFLKAKIAKGDLDLDDLFDDAGKVKADVLSETLKEILEEKPRLAEAAGGEEGKRNTADGSADAGKGKGADADDASVEDEFKKIRRNKD